MTYLASNIIEPRNISDELIFSLEIA